MFTYVIDACSLIAYLREEAGAERVHELFEDALSGNINIYLHRVTMAEALYDSLRTNKSNTPKQITAIFHTLPVRMADTLSDEFLLMVAFYKVWHKVSFADCFVLALAKLHNAKVITADHHEFDAIEQAGEVEFEWIR